ncbi:MAG: sporulation protein [Lachnospiraceae bacterium]|nr:sporulation protein [Lachnospiraceae bacterium]
MVGYIRLFRGYVRIRVESPSPQRFLNLCSVQDISLWDIVSDGDWYEMNLSVADFFRLKPIVKKTKTKVVLTEKKGLPFRMQKWKKRKVFILCSILCVVGLYGVSLFLWDIRLVNEGKLTSEMLLSFLQDNGVTYGSYKKGIDIDAIEKKLRDEYPFIIWTSLRLEGTRLFVDVKENDQTVEVSDVSSKQACNLHATVSGTVVSIVTRSGIPQVQIGDEVKKGDLLVVGEVPIYNDDETIKEYMYVCSDADIRLETRLSYGKELPLAYSKKVYTGQEKTAYYFRVYKNSFSTARIPDYELYDIVTDLKQGKILHDFYLPLYYGRITYQEYRLEEFVYTETEGRALLEAEFQKFCKTLQQKGVQIVEKNVKIEKNGRSLRADGSILVEMSDGEPQIITEMKQTGETEIE